MGFVFKMLLESFELFWLEYRGDVDSTIQSDEIMAIFGSTGMRNGFGRVDNDSANENGKWHMNENENHMQIAYQLIHNDFFYNSHRNGMNNKSNTQANVLSHRAKCSSLKWAWAWACMSARMIWLRAIYFIKFQSNFHAIFDWVLGKRNCSFDLPDVLKAFRGNINWGNSAN